MSAYAGIVRASDVREQGRQAARNHEPREGNPYVLWAYLLRGLWFAGFDEVR